MAEIKAKDATIKILRDSLRDMERTNQSATTKQNKSKLELAKKAMELELAEERSRKCKMEL